MYTNLSTIDIAIISIVGVSVLTGLYRGFVRELLALGIWIFSFWGASHYSKHFSIYLKPYITQDALRMVIAFVSMMFIILILGSLLSSLFSMLLKRSGLSGTDRILGMVFGWVRGAFIIALIIVVAKIAGFPEKDYAETSKLYRTFNPVVEWMSSYVPKILAQLQSIDAQKSSLAMVSEFNTEDVIQQSAATVVNTVKSSTELSQRVQVQGLESMKKPN